MSSINQKISTSFSYQSLISYSGNLNQSRIHIYRQKMRSICYSTIITRFDITRIVSKLIEFLTNLDSYYLIAADHCIKYLHATRYLALKFDVSENEKLIVQMKNKSKSSNKHVFKTSVDASYVNKKERRSDENYIFKLFDELID